MVELLTRDGVEIAPGPASAEVDLTLTRTERDEVFVRGRIAGEFHVACARCLAPARIEARDDDLQLTFLKDPAPGSREALTIEDLDTFAHDGEVVDLAPVVREMLLLAIPITPLCDPDCRGICAVCGCNRNEEACDCSAQEQLDTPWSEALSRLRGSIGNR